MKPLGLHPCNDTDKFFEAVINQRSFLPEMKRYAYCIDNLNEQKLWGNTDSGFANALQMRLYKCDSSVPNSKCKSDVEINDWLDQNGHLTLLAND